MTKQQLNEQVSVTEEGSEIPVLSTQNAYVCFYQGVGGWFPFGCNLRIVGSTQVERSQVLYQDDSLVTDV